MTEIIVQRLKDRIAELEYINGLDRTLTGKIREMFDTDRGSADVIGVLYRRQFVTRDALYAVICSERPECDWPEQKTLDNLIFKVRKKFGEFGMKVETIGGEGWSIPAESRARLRAMIDPRHDEAVEQYRRAFGLYPKEAQVLAMMMDRGTVTASSLREIASSFGAVRVQMHRTRRALEAFGIEIVCSCGRWSLSDLNKTKVRAALVTFCNDLIERRRAFVDGP